jgi:hypothetical protein
MCAPSHGFVRLGQSRKVFKCENCKPIIRATVVPVMDSVYLIRFTSYTYLKVVHISIT